MKKIFSVIIVSIVIIASFITWFNLKQKNHTTGIVSEYEPSKYEILLLEKMKDWKIYRNEKYGFVFRYPKEWTIEEKTEKDFGFNYSTELSVEGKKIYEEGVHVYLKNYPYEWRLVVYDELTEGMAKSGKLINTKDETIISIDGLSIGFYRSNILEEVQGPGKFLEICRIKEWLRADRSNYDASCNTYLKSGKIGVDNVYRVGYLFYDWEDYPDTLDIRKGDKDKAATEIMDRISRTFMFIK